MMPRSVVFNQLYKTLIKVGPAFSELSTPNSWKIVQSNIGVRHQSNIFAPTTISLDNNFNLKKDVFITKKFSSSNGISIANYKEIKDLPNHPEKLLIDVREPDELQTYGKIPASINIPLNAIKRALTMPEKYFKIRYAIIKPSHDACIIFTSESGKQSEDAAKIAIRLGYKNVKNYKGSWIDWAEHEGIPIPS